jgi:hypothetical protein
MAVITTTALNTQPDRAYDMLPLLFAVVCR